VLTYRISAINRQRLGTSSLLKIERRCFFTVSRPRRPEGEPSGVEPRILVFRKRAVPAVSEIKGQHVEHEHGVVPARASSKGFAQRVSEIVFALFRCHRDISGFLQS